MTDIDITSEYVIRDRTKRFPFSCWCYLSVADRTLVALSSINKDTLMMYLLSISKDNIKISKDTFYFQTAIKREYILVATVKLKVSQKEGMGDFLSSGT